jgi:hypothetical protein
VRRGQVGELRAGACGRRRLGPVNGAGGAGACERVGKVGNRGAKALAGQGVWGQSLVVIRCRGGTRAWISGDGREQGAARDAMQARGQGRGQESGSRVWLKRLSNEAVWARTLDVVVGLARPRDFRLAAAAASES